MCQIQYKNKRRKSLYLVSLYQPVRKNRYLLTVQDGFTRFASANPICNKEASVVARVLIREHFSVFSLLNQIDFNTGGELVNQCGKTYLKLKILHTKTTPYNSCLRTIVGILRAMGRVMQDEWNLGVKAYNTTLQTPFFTMFWWEATLPVNWICSVNKADKCSNLQIDCVPVQGWEMGLGFLSEDCTWKLWQVKIILGWTVPDYKKNISSIRRCNDSVQTGPHRFIQRIQRR